MKVIIEFEEEDEIDVPQIEKQLNWIKGSKERFSSYDKFNIGGCFITSTKTVKNKTICELSYDFVEPTFINLNEINEKPKEEKKKFSLIKRFLDKN